MPEGLRIATYSRHARRDAIFFFPSTCFLFPVAFDRCDRCASCQARWKTRDGRALQARGSGEQMRQRRSSHLLMPGCEVSANVSLAFRPRMKASGLPLPHVLHRKSGTDLEVIALPNRRPGSHETGFHHAVSPGRGKNGNLARITIASLSVQESITDARCPKGLSELPRYLTHPTLSAPAPLLFLAPYTRGTGFALAHPSACSWPT